MADDDVWQRIGRRYGGYGFIGAGRRDPAKERFERLMQHEAQLPERLQGVGEAEWIKERLARGLSWEEMARRSGCSVENLRNTLEIDAEDGTDVVRWPYRFRSWMDGLLSRLSKAAQALLPAKKGGHPVTTDHDYIRKVLEDTRGDTSLTSLITGASVRTVHYIKSGKFDE